MSKKDKKIEIQIVDSKVTVGKDTFDGFTLSLERKRLVKLQTWLGNLPLSKMEMWILFTKNLKKPLKF